MSTGFIGFIGFIGFRGYIYKGLFKGCVRVPLRDL